MNLYHVNIDQCGVGLTQNDWNWNTEMSSKINFYFIEVIEIPIILLKFALENPKLKVTEKQF